MQFRPKSSQFVYKEIAMETTDNISTLSVKICGSIESPPDNNRELFKQSVIETVLHILKTEDVVIEYIGYKADASGVHPLDQNMTEYEDCVFVSLNVRGMALNPLDGTQSNQDIIKTFVEVFEDKTHRHLEIDSTLIRKGKKQRIIEMSSDWKLYLKHG